MKQSSSSHTPPQVSIYSQPSECTPRSLIQRNSNGFAVDTSQKFPNAQKYDLEKREIQERQTNYISLLFSAQEFQSQDTSSIVDHRYDLADQPPTCPCCSRHCKEAPRDKTFCDQCSAPLRNQETWFCEACNYDLCQDCDKKNKHAQGN